MVATWFTLHFTPTSSSWLNLVERWFRELTEKQVRLDDFRSVSELITAIEGCLAVANANPKPLCDMPLRSNYPGQSRTL